MTQSYDTIIVGAGAGAASLAEALRARGYTRSILIVGDETHLPYDRPPLSKQLLSGQWTHERLQLRPAEQYAAQGIEFRLGTRAIGLDVAARRLELAGGEHLGYENLVVATGVSPRAFGDGIPGVYTVHALDGVLALRERLQAAPCRVIVVGAGVLGSEAAASLVSQGHGVTLLARGDAVLDKAFRPDISSRVSRAHAEAGVHLVSRAEVVGVDAQPSGELSVVTSDGRSFAGDIVIIAAGSVPNTEWLAGSGLELDNGVVCDDHGRAAPGVFAIGDVSSWLIPSIGTHVRIEHRQNASNQAEVVAAVITGEEPGPLPPKYFWSDHYSHKIQAYGELQGAGTPLLLWENAEQGRQVIGYVENGRLVGAVGWNAPREIHKYRARIGSPID